MKVNLCIFDLYNQYSSHTKRICIDFQTIKRKIKNKDSFSPNLEISWLDINIAIICFFRMSQKLCNKRKGNILSTFKSYFHIFFTLVLHHSKLYHTKAFLTNQLSITLYLRCEWSLDEIHFDCTFEALNSNLYLCLYDWER